MNRRIEVEGDTTNIDVVQAKGPGVSEVIWYFHVIRDEGYAWWG